MTDPIADIIGDYRAFAAQQRDRLLAGGINIAPFELSHLAFRVPEWDLSRARLSQPVRRPGWGCRRRAHPGGVGP